MGRGSAGQRPRASWALLKGEKKRGSEEEGTQEGHGGSKTAGLGKRQDEGQPRQVGQELGEETEKRWQREAGRGPRWGHQLTHWMRELNPIFICPEATQSCPVGEHTGRGPTHGGQTPAGDGARVHGEGQSPGASNGFSAGSTVVRKTALR